jgi:ATP-dependent DNA helicase RecG
MEKLRLKHRPTTVYDYIRPAVEHALLALTQPDSPNSPTQKYRLTVKGKDLKIKIGGEER